MIDLYNTLLDVRARSAEAGRRIGLSHAMGGSGRPRMIDLYNTLLDVRARSAEAGRSIGLSYAIGGSGRP
ncbi:MAG: hypothetical protein ABSG35_21510 [Syntrophobacteraceae bacterium]|jgi:FMN phosphatase YigB (HAD superfamily)